MTNNNPHTVIRQVRTHAQTWTHNLTKLWSFSSLFIIFSILEFYFWSLILSFYCFRTVKTILVLSGIKTSLVICMTAKENENRYILYKTHAMVLKKGPFSYHRPHIYKKNLKKKIKRSKQWRSTVANLNWAWPP